MRAPFAGLLLLAACSFQVAAAAAPVAVAVIGQDGGKVMVRFTPVPGVYVFRDSIEVSQPERGSVRLRGIPGGRDLKLLGGTTERVVDGEFEVSGRVSELTTELSVRYRSCSSIGLCYPPQSQVHPIRWGQE